MAKSNNPCFLAGGELSGWLGNQHVRRKQISDRLKFGRRFIHSLNGRKNALIRMEL